MKRIQSRVDRIENKLQAEYDRHGPVDLFGKYYDELPPSDRWRWWHYCYNGRCPFKTLEDAESYELRVITDSLHFRCREIIDLNDSFQELDDFMIQVGRRDFLEP